MERCIGKKLGSTDCKKEEYWKGGNEGDRGQMALLKQRLDAVTGAGQMPQVTVKTWLRKETEGGSQNHTPMPSFDSLHPVL